MTATFFSQLQERIPNEVMTTLIDGVLGVETELRAQVQSDIRMVQDIGEHTLEAGGKRLRPALVMLSAQATGLPYLADRCVKLGACLEMIHMATLVHDDVIDGASTRRGRATAPAGAARRPGASLAILLASSPATYYWRRPCASWP